MVSAEGIAEGINSQDGLSWQCLKNTVLSEGVCAEGIPCGYLGDPDGKISLFGFSVVTLRLASPLASH